MVGDPNWLYSTIAQSSAAIVAIVGGFITTGILSRRAEKASLSNQLSDKKSQLKGLQNYRPRTIWANRATDEEIQSRREHMDSIQEKISLLRAEVSDLETRLKAFSYPPNLGWGICVLGYLAVFGILVPVLIIVYEAFFTWAKVLTTVSFWLGIIGVFTFIVFQLRALRRPPDASR
jgi:polyhydroxyalkanoate synthesis regulator phasin